MSWKVEYIKRLVITLSVVVHVDIVSFPTHIQLVIVVAAAVSVVVAVVVVVVFVVVFIVVVVKFILKV